MENYPKPVDEMIPIFDIVLGYITDPVERQKSMESLLHFTTEIVKNVVDGENADPLAPYSYYVTKEDIERMKEHVTPERSLEQMVRELYIHRANMAWREIIYDTQKKTVEVLTPKE